MRRGDITLAELDPVVGSEQGKVRPVVVVSNDGANAWATAHGSGVVTVVPLTSSVISIYPFQVLLLAEETGLSRDSKAQAEQVRSISASRISSVIGSLSAELLAEVDEALRIHLAL